MERRKDILITIICDFVTLIIVWYCFYYARFELGWFMAEQPVAPATLFTPAVVTAIFWIGIFAFFGLYKRLYLTSRFDETIRVAKISIIGTLIFFFLLFADDLNWTQDNISNARNLTVLYWVLVFSLVSLNRFIIRTIQRLGALRGQGLHKAIIIGVGKTAQSVKEDIQRHKTSGLDVIGFVNHKVDPDDDVAIDNNQILGNINEINRLIETLKVQDIIVAMEPDDRYQLIPIMDKIEHPNISVKIVPDIYQIISGLNQTNQIFGLPLIEVMPDPMPTWEKFSKRFFDIVMSLAILVLALPIMILVAITIKLTSTGSAIFAQKRVGLNGKPFTMYKFRSMYTDAEEKTGPVWAKDDDPRITPVGYWLRRLRLDEFPQLFNVLKGDMSLVGPRPERQFFVDQFKQKIPLYTRRLRVRPGITGWAQVKWKYDETFDDVIEKTKYDLFYVENISLKMDIKILINTISTMITGKGK